MPSFYAVPATSPPAAGPGGAEHGGCHLRAGFVVDLLGQGHVLQAAGHDAAQEEAVEQRAQRTEADLVAHAVGQPDAAVALGEAVVEEVLAQRRQRSLGATVQAQGNALGIAPVGDRFVTVPRPSMRTRRCVPTPSRCAPTNVAAVRPGTYRCGPDRSRSRCQAAARSMSRGASARTSGMRAANDIMRAAARRATPRGVRVWRAAGYNSVRQARRCCHLTFKDAVR